MTYKVKSWDNPFKEDGIVPEKLFLDNSLLDEINCIHK